MNFEKLKDAARKFEQKEDWRRAIEVYLKAIQEFESGQDSAPDLSIYNRVGDLYLKANEPSAAVQAYERAADLYSEQGFYNNAIALCGKILRVNPGRIQTYLKLAHLHASKNVVIEAKKNLLEYLDRMNALNQLDEAFKAMKGFADQFPGNKDIRLMLSELLRASSRNEEAKEQLEKLASDLEARGDAVGVRKTLMRLQAIESGDAGAPAAGAKPKKTDLIFLDTGLEIPALPARPQRATPPAGPRSTTGAPARPSTAKPAGGKHPEPARESEPLKIETSGFAEEMIDLEPVQPISEEAAMERTSFDVGKTLGFEPTIQEDTELDRVAPLEGLEIDTPPPDSVDLASPGLEVFSGLEVGSDLAIEHDPSLDLGPLGDESFESERSEVLETSLTPLEETDQLDPDLDFDLEGLPSAPPPDVERDSLGLDLVEADEAPEAEAVGVPKTGAKREPGTAPQLGSRRSVAVPFLEVTEPKMPSIAELEERVLDDPENPETHRALGEALLAAGEGDRGAEELDLALAAYENREDWEHATDVAHELIRLDPSGVRYHQKLVELAYRTGDKPRLIEAYVELGDALMRAGALDKALSVYRRVADHDPGNRRALAALESLAPVEPPPLPPPAKPAGGKRPSKPAVPKPAPPPPSPVSGDMGDFIDLGALIREDDTRTRDLRMKVGDEEPTGDEQRDFDDMLTQFKRGIDENIDAEDFQSHYDLGVAFKEMGLLDEAIAEFQKALRSPEGRLRTSEALGVAFYEKGQYGVAEAILKRAVESLGATDDEQIGLIYWLGRSAEAQGKVAGAIPCYERVLAVDIGFQDVRSRMSKLVVGRDS